MKAAVYVGDPKTLALEDLKPNPPGPRDVVVEIGASGVCHSDLSIMRGYVPVPPGMVLGHEGAGRVVEVVVGVAARATRTAPSRTPGAPRRAATSC